MNPLPLSSQVSQRKLSSFVQPSESGEELMGLLGMEVCEPEYRIERNGFPFVLMEFIEKGSMDIVLDGEERRLKRGGLLCYGPGSRVSMRVTSEGGCTKHFIALCPSSIPTLSSFRGLLSEGGSVLSDKAPVIPMMKFISLIGDLADEAALWDSLSRAIDSLGHFVRSIPQEGKVDSTPSDEVYRRIALFVGENFMTLRNLEEIARKCGYDKSYLCQLYRRYSDVSPYQQLVRMKVEYACILLETTNWTVKAIAQNLGYEDSLHFSRLFRSKVGVSPNAFRSKRA
ncbi:AraC family transcriptional regulator [Pelagicoccus albus]